MRSRSLRLRIVGLTATLAVAGLASGCGKSLSAKSTASSPGSVAAVSAQGAGGLSTKNTTRLGGPESVTDAAAVAETVYPGLTRATRPRAVVLVDLHDWPAALAASTLAGSPLHAPLLYSNGISLPQASAVALGTMKPIGTGAFGESGDGPTTPTQVVQVGTTATPAGYATHSISAENPAALAVALEQASSIVRKRAPHELIVTAAEGAPAMTMPAAGLAAQTGAPILFVGRSFVPSATAVELRRLGKPSIYIVGPTSVVSERVSRRLARFGKVTRIAGTTPASNAIAVARFTDGSFGWGVLEPGHGLVFASSARPLDGPAAAPLAATGDYAPLLLLENPDAIPAPLGAYLSDLQPGSPPSGPVHGVYNHGWVIGDTSAISATTQASLDGRLEIASRSAPETPISSTKGATGEPGQTTQAGEQAPASGAGEPTTTGP
jgi:ell wall binding domain 2 (CWB2)